MGGKVNIGGTWKDISGVSVNIGGTWKTATSLKCNIGGTWKDGWSSVLTYTSDLCTGGTAISGGDYESYTAANLFDNNESSTWSALQASGATSGAAYIGYDFGLGVTKHIRRIRLLHYGTNWSISSGKVQRSSNGTDWTDVATISMSSTAGWETYDIASSGASRYWRVLANSNTPLQHWSEYEMEMMEVAS